LKQNGGMAADHEFDADSLDRVERDLAIDAFLERIAADETLSPQRREQLIREIHARMDSDDFWEDDGWSLCLDLFLQERQARVASHPRSCGFSKSQTSNLKKPTKKSGAPSPHTFSAAC